MTQFLPTPNVPEKVWDALKASEDATNAITGAVHVTLAANDQHEEHPESMRPRVFYSVVQDEGGHGTVFYVRHYEMLQTGYAIPWKTLPEGKFDFLHFIVKSQSQVRLSHADAPSPAYWSGTTVPINGPVGPSIPTLEGR
jgi:hypothetical protein